MKKIELSSHAVLKVEILKKHGIIIDEDFVNEVIISPDKIDRGYKGRLIAQKELDKEHVLRVVYENKPEHILVITLYPGKKERYEKD
ncbi:MAG: DUF4258 domain-containing protein [bacterium]